MTQAGSTGMFSASTWRAPRWTRSICETRHGLSRSEPPPALGALRFLAHLPGGAPAPCASPPPALGSRWRGACGGGSGGRLALVAASGARQAPLPALRRRPFRGGDRRVDPAGGAVLAGVPADGFDLPAGRHRLPAQHLLSGARPSGGHGRRPVAAAQAADRHRSVPGGLRRPAGLDGGVRGDERGGLSRHRSIDRRCERLRDAGAPDIGAGDRRGAGAGDERARRQRHGVQHRPHGGAGDCRRGARLSLGGLVLRAQRRSAMPASSPRCWRCACRPKCRVLPVVRVLRASPPA